MGETGSGANLTKPGFPYPFLPVSTTIIRSFLSDPYAFARASTASTRARAVFLKTSVGSPSVSQRSTCSVQCAIRSAVCLLLFLRRKVYSRRPDPALIDSLRELEHVHQFDAVLGLGLVVQRAHVIANRLFGDPEIIRNAAVRFPEHDELKHARFLSGDPVFID